MATNDTSGKGINGLCNKDALDIAVAKPMEGDCDAETQAHRLLELLGEGPFVDALRKRGYSVEEDPFEDLTIEDAEDVMNTLKTFLHKADGTQVTIRVDRNEILVDTEQGPKD